MNALLKYELKKNYFKKSVIIILIVFTIANIWKCNDLKVNYGRFSHMNSVEIAYRDLVNERLSGIITADKIQFVMKEYEQLAYIVDNTDYSTEYDENRYTGYVFGDYGLFRFYIIPDMEYAYLYSQYSADIVENAVENEKFYADISNIYQVKENILIQKLYQNRNIPSFYDTDGIQEFLSYDFSVLLSVMMIVLAVSSAFCMEKESGMYMILSTAATRKKLIKPKILAAIIYSLFIGTYFFVVDFIIFAVFWGIHGVFNPIYSLANFQYTPLNCSIFTFIAIRLLLRLVFTTVACLICLICSCVIKSSRLSFGCSLTITTVSIAMVDLFPSNIFNPAVLLNNNMVNSFRTIAVDNIPILSYYAAITVSVIYLLLLSLLLKRRVRKW